MFGKIKYRYPYLTIFCMAIVEFRIPIIIQALSVLFYDITQNVLFTLCVISTFLFIMGLTLFWISKYNKMLEIAYRDSVISEKLARQSWINRRDYLLWATMEAFKRYKVKIAY